MILEITISGEVHYIDTELILYGFDNTGLNLVVNQSAIRYNPASEIFVSNAIQAPTLPTYADFVTATTDNYFLECAHATYTIINVNLLRIKRLEVIDASNTTIIFEIGASVDVNVAVADLLTAINTKLRGHLDTSEDFVSDGSGVVTVANDYVSGSWNVYLRGVLVRRADVSETGARQLTLAVTTEIDDFINVQYKY